MDLGSTSKGLFHRAVYCGLHYRNNLGLLYAMRHEYEKAAEQFVSALIDGPPVGVQGEWQDNLAEAYLETGKNDLACQAWQRAADLPRSKPDMTTVLGTAICSLVTGQPQQAAVRFCAAQELAQEQNVNLLEIKTYEGWYAGPNQIIAAKKLIKQAER